MRCWPGPPARLGLGAQAGMIGGLSGALGPLHLPVGIFYGGLGEEFAALSLVGILVASLARWNSEARSARGSVLLGLAWGAAFHIAPALLPVMCSALLFELWWRRDRRRLLHPALILLGAGLACVPWAVRNYGVFGEWIFIRSNLGLELRMGNHEGASADIDRMGVSDGLDQSNPLPVLHPRAAARGGGEAPRGWRTGVYAPGPA